MAWVHYCSQLCGVCSLSRLMWAPTLSAPIITIYSVCFSFMRIENGSSRSRHHESSFSEFPWPISQGNFYRCRCKLLLIFLNHSQMLPHHNHPSEWKTIVKKNFDNKSAEVGCTSLCFLYISQSPVSMMWQKDDHFGACEMPSKLETESAAS